MRINGSVCAYLRTYRSIHGCFFHTTPFSCRHDSRNRTAHDSGHIAVSGIQVRDSLPSGKQRPRRPARHQSASGRAPLVMIVSIPCAVASRTACNFVFIPPRPRREPAPPAIAYTPSSMHSIRESSRASGCRRGSLSYSPSISEKITSRFALREKKPLRSPSGHFCTTLSETGGRHSQTSRKNIACCRHGKNRLPTGETDSRNTDKPEGSFRMKPEIHSLAEISSLFRPVAVSVTFSCR